MKRAVRLSDALRATGFRLVRCARPGSHPDRLGKGTSRVKAQVLRGRRVAVVADSWRYAYEAAHEIAESRHRFRHNELMWMHQCNLLAMWHRLRSGERDIVGLHVGAVDPAEESVR